MTHYYTREEKSAWQPCDARTIKSALRVAAKRRIYQGSTVYVGAQMDGRIALVASDRPATYKQPEE